MNTLFNAFYLCKPFILWLKPLIKHHSSVHFTTNLIAPTRHYTSSAHFLTRVIMRGAPFWNYSDSQTVFMLPKALTFNYLSVVPRKLFPWVGSSYNIHETGFVLRSAAINVIYIYRGNIYNMGHVSYMCRDKSVELKSKLVDIPLMWVELPKTCVRRRVQQFVHIFSCFHANNRIWSGSFIFALNPLRRSQHGRYIYIYIYEYVYHSWTNTVFLQIYMCVNPQLLCTEYLGFDTLPPSFRLISSFTHAHTNTPKCGA